MSYRPTISVYLEGKIIDIGYYRNWKDKYLLYEAVAIAAFFGDCRTREEYLERRYGAGNVCYSVYPEVFDNSEESLKELEDCSEMPVLVDLTARCIDMAAGALPEERLRERPSILDDLPSYGTRSEWRQIPESQLPPDPEEAEDDCLVWLERYCRGWERVEEPVTDLRRISVQSDFYTLLNNCRIPYGQLDLEEIRQRYLEFTEDGTRGLSEDMLYGIRRTLAPEREKPGCEKEGKTVYFRK